MEKPNPPKNLADAGATLWREVVGKWDLRPDELSTLEDACREVDIIAQMERFRMADDFEMFVRGSQGQQVINPVISELRQHAMAKKALLAQLKLPDEADTAEARSTQARSAANARWSKRGA